MTFAGAAALALAGCSGSSNLFDSNATSGMLSKPIDNIFSKPDWATSGTQARDLGPSGPVGAEDLVNADGSCAPAAVETSQVAAAPAPAATEPVSDRLQPDGGGFVPASGPTVLGGIALGMSECQAVRRAGAPSNVAMSANEKGERKVVITYASGTWPGIYTFTSGRLQTVEMLPESQRPKPQPKKPAPKRARTS